MTVVNFGRGFAVLAIAVELPQNQMDSEARIGGFTRGTLPMQVKKATYLAPVIRV
jgi:hypothetical protein